MDAGLTQEELAVAAQVSPRSVSDLERGITLTARKETARLLADGLSLTGPEKAEFELMATGRGTANRSLAWRAAVRAAIEPGGSAGPGPPLAAMLSEAYQAALPRSILAEGDAPGRNAAADAG